MRIVQKFAQILDLSYTSDLCIGFSFTEIDTEVWTSFSCSIRSGSVLPQQKCSAMAVHPG